MRLINDVSEREVVRTFLAADFGSSRSDCHQRVVDGLAAKGLPLICVSPGAPIPDALALKLRSVLFEHCHGGTLQGLPLDKTVWHRAEVVDGDSVFLMNLDEFHVATDGTLKPQDAAAGFPTNRCLDEVVARIREGASFPPLICVARSETSPAVILDGSQRAVAFAELSMLVGTEVLLGISDRMDEWIFFPKLHI